MTERQRKAEQTRARLIAAARELFTAKGYYATGTGEIGTAAGVGTRGAFYHHFPTKPDLFEAVFRDVEERLIVRVAERITATASFELLRQGLHAFLDEAMEPEVQQIVLIDGPAVLGWERWRELDSQYGLASIRGLLVAARDEGAITVPSVDILAQMLLATVDEGAQFIAHAEDQKAVLVAARDTLDALLNGLRTAGAPAAGRRPRTT